MKILLLCWRDTGHPEGGGSERYLERVASYLADHGHDVVFRTARYPGSEALTGMGELHTLKSGALGVDEAASKGVMFSRAGGNFTVYTRAWLAMLGARLSCGRIKFGPIKFGPMLVGPIAKALGGKPDVVVDTQNGVPFFAQLFSGAPTVLLTHHCHREQWPVAGPIVGRIGWLIESTISPLIHRRCRYITVSEPSREDLVSLGVERNRIDVIRNGVDPIPAGCGGSIEGTKAEPAPRLVTLSRLVPHKQIEHAIDALAAISPDHPDAVLDIIGSGWWADELRAYAFRCGLSDRIVFHGQVSEEEKHRILSHASVHLMPSRKEGWGLAVIESAQHGVPTIGYRSSAGLRDSVVDGTTGILVDSQAELAEATRRLLDDASLHQAMSQACISRAAEFGWDKTAKAVENVLVSVAKHDSTGH